MLENQMLHHLPWTHWSSPFIRILMKKWGDKHWSNKCINNHFPVSLDPQQDFMSPKFFPSFPHLPPFRATWSRPSRIRGARREIHGRTEDRGNLFWANEMSLSLQHRVKLRLFLMISTVQLMGTALLKERCTSVISYSASHEMFSSSVRSINSPTSRTSDINHNV